MRQLTLPRGILSGKMMEIGSEVSNQTAADPSVPPDPLIPVNNNLEPDVGDPETVIDEELLFEKVKKFPMLYEHAYADYMERIAKTKIWRKVCQSLFKEWTGFSPRKKRLTIKTVQNRWRRCTDTYFKKHNGVRESPKNTMDSLAFLLPPTDPPIDPPQVSIGSVMPKEMPLEYPWSLRQQPEPQIPLQPELDVPNIPENPPMASTSEQAGQYTGTWEFPRPYDVRKCTFIPMRHPQNANPNTHFALMLIPLLDRLPHDALYQAWPAILNTIKNYDFPQRVEQIGRKSLYEATGVAPAGVAGAPPEEEAVQDNPIYQSRYGRPTNADGEIMYPETDHEDLDEV